MKTKHIYLVWFIALLPTMLLRDFTLMNELRYLSIADEALRNGNIFTFTNQGVIYTDKPPLYFWLMNARQDIVGRSSHVVFVVAFIYSGPCYSHNHDQMDSERKWRE